MNLNSKLFIFSNYLFLFVLFCCCFTSCKVHRVFDCPAPCLDIPDAYPEIEAGEEWSYSWWEEFDDPRLNGLIEDSFCHNLDIQEAWNRLIQARAEVCINYSFTSPQLNLFTIIGQDEGLGPGRGGEIIGFDSIGDESFTFDEAGANRNSFAQFFISGQVSYEVDLWRKIDSQFRASCQEMLATKEDLEATVLTLTGIITETYFTIREQKALLQLFEEQIASNQTQLELIELRFVVGEASALDVYQQRLQLAQTEAQVPPVKAALKTAQNQLQVLLGKVPTQTLSQKPEEFDIDLPPFPYIGTPWELLCNRPDLRSAHHSLIAADFEVGVAIADRFPQLDVLLSLDFTTTDLSQIFQRTAFFIAGNILAPLIDGGRRECEVKRREAIVWERLNRFGNVFLRAMQEVEDAIVQEKEQKELLKLLDNQMQIAESTLRESNIRYINGLTNYLDVIAAIQSLQNVQRQIINERKNLLSFRANLYRSLGGSFCLTKSCECGEI